MSKRRRRESTLSIDRVKLLLKAAKEAAKSYNTSNFQKLKQSQILRNLTTLLSPSSFQNQVDNTRNHPRV